MAVGEVCCGIGCWIGNSVDLPDAALCLVKILRDLVCSVTFKVKAVCGKGG